MYYELGTMVAIKKDASPFVDHDKGISIPSLDVVGEIVGIRPMILSYAVRLSKKYVLTFNEDDIYGLPGWMSDKYYMFQRMLRSIAVDVHPFYYVEEFEDYVSRADELNRREFERIAASPIRIEIDDMIKANYSKEEIKKMINLEFGWTKSVGIKKVIFNGPCTIILWEDGTKTIAKASSDEEVFDPEKGVAICFMKKMLGHTETNKILRKASEQYKEYIAENRPNSSFDEFIDFCKDYFKSETKSVNHIDQSAIEEVKKVEEDHKMDFRSCSTCKYASKPVTDKPCSKCASKSHYEKGYEK